MTVQKPMWVKTPEAEIPDDGKGFTIEVRVMVRSNAVAHQHAYNLSKKVFDELKLQFGSSVVQYGSRIADPNLPRAQWEELYCDGADSSAFYEIVVEDEAISKRGWNQSHIPQPPMINHMSATVHVEKATGAIFCLYPSGYRLWWIPVNRRWEMHPSLQYEKPFEEDYQGIRRDTLQSYDRREGDHWHAVPADPELERLLDEEEAIAHRNWHDGIPPSPSPSSVHSHPKPITFSEWQAEQRRRSS